MAARLTTAEKHLRALLERQVQEQYRKAALAVGCRVYHNRAGRFVDAGSKGFPDLVVLSPVGHLLYVEWKREEGVVHPEQVGWHDALAAAGQTVVVYRPRDWERAMVQLETMTGRPVPAELRVLPRPRPKSKPRRGSRAASPPAP